MKKVTKIVMPVAILVIAFLAMVGLLSLKSEPEKRPPTARAKVVETEVVSLLGVQTEVTAYGRVASAQPVQLFAEVSGTLEAGDIPFKPSQSFSRGDLLLKIDERQAQLNLNSVKSDLMTALATVLPEIKVDFPDEYRIWQDYFDSCQFGKKADPLPETSNPRIKLFLSRFNVYKLFFTVRDLEILLEKHYFYAPFDGSIVSADLRVGSTARNGTALGQIINLEQMEVAVPVEADDIRWIDTEQPVVFTSTEVAGQWTGKISRIGSDIDTRTQTVQVYMELDNTQTASLLNGVFLQAHIPGRLVEDALAVPPKAIYEDGYVYVIADGCLERRKVEIIRRENTRVVVSGDLKNGDTLVTDIMQGVAPGMPARSRGAASETGGQ